MGGVVVQQGRPGHFQFEFGDFERRRLDHQAGVLGLHARHPAGQGGDQVVVHRQQGRHLVVAGKNADLAGAADTLQGVVDPAQAAEFFRIHAKPHPEAGLRHPDMLGGQVAVEVEVPGDGVVAVEQAGKRIPPQGHLVERTGDLVEPVHGHVHPALFHVRIAHVGRGQKVQHHVGGLFTQSTHDMRY